MSNTARDLLLQHLQQRRDNGEDSVFLDPQVAARVAQLAGQTADGGQQKREKRPEPAARSEEAGEPRFAQTPRRSDRDEQRERHFAPSPGGENMSLSALKDELSREDQPAQRPSRRTAGAPVPAQAGGRSPGTVQAAPGAGAQSEFFSLGKIPGEANDPRIQALHEIYQRVEKFTAENPLATLRDTMVFAVGNPYAKLMFVGEAPGADEEQQREPFVGRAGQLLTKMIGAMKLRREEVYISNIVKYRPRMPDGKETGNRKPSADEIAAYRQFVLEEIRIIKPQAIVALGSTSAEGLLGLTEPIGKTRGRWHDLEDTGSPVMVTYHPAFLLRNASNKTKRIVWEDLLQVMERLQMPISEKQRNYFLKDDR